MSFSILAFRCAEPAYSNVQPSPGDEVHGVAFKLDKPSQEKLDKQEAAYRKEIVELEAYDGRKLKGFVYYNESMRTESTPSKRYLGILVKGTDNCKWFL